MQYPLHILSKFSFVSPSTKTLHQLLLKLVIEDNKKVFITPTFCRFWSGRRPSGIQVYSNKHLFVCVYLDDYINCLQCKVYSAVCSIVQGSVQCTLQCKVQCPLHLTTTRDHTCSAVRQWRQCSAQYSLQCSVLCTWHFTSISLYQQCVVITAKKNWSVRR